MDTPDGPLPDDLVLRREWQQGLAVLVLHRHAGPDQIVFRTRDEAVTRGLRYARRLGVRLWISDGQDGFTLCVSAMSAGAI